MSQAASPPTSPPSPVLVPPPPATVPFEAPLPAQAPSPKGTGLISPNAPTAEEVYRFPANVAPEYILGPGDILKVQDFSTGELGQAMENNLVILPDGTVNIHPIGIVHAAGMTVRGLNELVNTKAKEFFIRPDIAVSVLTTRPSVFYVLGEVTKPGLYSAESTQGATLPTITTAIARAGGVKETGDVRNIRITRVGAQQAVRANLWDLLVEGDVSQDLRLEPGDVVFVPRGGTEFDQIPLGMAANPNRRVRILGAVKTPGLYEMTPDDDLISILARAGGFTNTAVTRYVYLCRVSRDGSISTEKVSTKRAYRDPNAVGRSQVQPGDLVLVRDSIWKKAAGGAYYGLVAIVTGTLLITFSLYLSKSINGNNSSSSSSSSGTSGSPGVIPLVPP